MRNTIVGQHIRRANRNLMLINGLLLAALVLMFAAKANYWVNFVGGPFPMSREEIVALPNADRLSHYYVRIDGEQVFPTGARHVEFNRRTRQGKQKVTAEYSALALGDQLLLVKHDPGLLPDRSIAGKLVPVPMAVRGQFTQQAEQELQRPGLFLPVMLDATGFRGTGYFMLGIGLPVGLLAVWNVSRAIARTGDAEKHPVSKRLLKYGLPGEVAEQIDAEANDSDECATVGKAILSKSWMLVPTTYGLQVRHLGEAVWSYKTMTQHRVNGIPTAKTYAAVCHFADGTATTVSMKSERLAEAFVKTVWERVPWIFVGFDDDLNKAWKKKRSDVLAALEGRKQHLLNEAAQETPTVQPAE
jgi:hypothetical protein